MYQDPEALGTEAMRPEAPADGLLDLAPGGGDEAGQRFLLQQSLPLQRMRPGSVGVPSRIVTSRAFPAIAGGLRGLQPFDRRAAGPYCPPMRSGPPTSVVDAGD